jgi:hypothetical protein
MKTTSKVYRVKLSHKSEGKFLSLVFVLFCVVTTAYSADRYWIAGSTASWNSTANWSTASGGAGGASVPVTADNVFFDGNGVGNCTVPSGTISINNLTVAAGYTGTISLGATALTVSQPVTLSGGNFLGGTSNILFYRGFTVSGTNFTSTSARLMSQLSTIAITSGTFNHNNGTVRFELNGLGGSGNDLTVSSSFTFNNLELAGPVSTLYVNASQQVNGNLLLDSSPGSLTLDASSAVIITVNGNMTTSADGNTTIMGTNLTFDLKGDFTQRNTGPCKLCTSHTIRFIGTGNQVLTSNAALDRGYISNVVINKPSGNLTYSGIISVNGTAWTYTAGTIVPSTSTLSFGARTISITGDQSFNNVISYPNFTSVTVVDDIIVNGNLTLDGVSASNTFNITAATGTVTVNGTLTLNGTNQITINNGTLYAKGDIYSTNTHTAGGGTGTLEISGTGNQYWDGSTSTGRGILPKLRINKPSGTLTLGPNPITYTGTFVYVAGTVDASTNSSTVMLTTGSSTTINAPAASMSFHNFVVTASFRSLTLQANIDFNGSLTIQSDATLDTSGSNYSVSIGGNYTTANSGARITSNSSTITFDGTGTQNFNPAATATLYRVTMNKPSGSLVLQRSLNISNGLTLTSGTITTTSTNILTLNNAATCNIGNANSYIDGPMQYIMAVAGSRTLNLPVGKAGTWRYAVLTPTHTTATSRTYTAELIASSASALGYTMMTTPAINQVSSYRYWQIDRSSASTDLLSATVQLFYDNEGIAEPAGLRIAKTDASGTNWTNIGGTGSAAGTGTITSNPFTSFSKFALANAAGGMNTLPITLTSFTGEFVKNQNAVKLDWRTVSEQDNDYFVVQLATGKDTTFRDIVTISSQAVNGNSSTLLSYVYEHLNPQSGDNYFRLKQVDFDGKSSVSDVIRINVTVDNLSIYPNPVVDGRIKVRFPSGNGASTYQCIITDPQGVTVFTRTIEVPFDNSEVVIEPEQHISSGVYFLQMISDTDRFASHLVIR